MYLLNMMRTLALVTLFLAANHLLIAQKGHDIRIKLDNYEPNELILGFHYGEKQFVKDTVTRDAGGYFVFKADTLLPAGVYLFVLKPDNNFIQVLVDKDNQRFSMTTDAKDSVKKMKVKGSEDNAAFYAYLNFLGDKRPEADTIRAQITRLKGSSPADSIKLAAQLTDIDKSVKKYQQDLIAKHPDWMGAKIIKASQEPEPPEFKGGTDKENQLKKYYWYRSHYFDFIDLGDPAMLRSPVIHSKVETYVTKIMPQHPDSVNIALDYVIGKMKPSEETYKYYLIHFLNYYAKSQLVGFDACYVHLAMNYYCKGLAPWTKKEDLEKICDNAARLEPILIGKIAPNIAVQDNKGQTLDLYSVDADYTVLFFWDPECGHCKKAAPHMVEFAKKFKDRGVKIFSVCTAVGEKAADCVKSIEEKGFSDEYFINTKDPYLRSRYKQLYDIKTTPQIFILDRKHEILMKRIGAEELSKIMEQVMQFHKK
jgi:thiol-disulfide isomerase/thioredoxin